MVCPARFGYLSAPALGHDGLCQSHFCFPGTAGTLHLQQELGPIVGSLQKRHVQQRGTSVSRESLGTQHGAPYNQKKKKDARFKRRSNRYLFGIAMGKFKRVQSVLALPESSPTGSAGLRPPSTAERHGRAESEESSLVKQNHGEICRQKSDFTCLVTRLPPQGQGWLESVLTSRTTSLHWSHPLCTPRKIPPRFPLAIPALCACDVEA